MRSAILSIFVLASGLLLAHPAAAQTDIPEGYTAYQISGPNLSTPPFPLKFENGEVSAPEGGLLQVTSSSIDDERAAFEFDTPFGPARFLGTPKGDGAYEGYFFGLSETKRFATPARLAPADRNFTDGPDTAGLASAADISRIEIVPGNVTLPSQERRRFVARVYDATGNEVADPDVEWFSGGGTIDQNGEFYGVNAGQRQVVAVVDGLSVGATTVTISSPQVVSLSIYTDVPATMTTGSRVTLRVHALNTANRWVLDPGLEIASSDPLVVAIDGMTLSATDAGRTTITVTGGSASRTYDIEVSDATGTMTITGAPDDAVRTGDVVNLWTTIEGAHPIWTVAGEGASVFDNGDFVAERPGTYTVLATLGVRTATQTISVRPRGKAGRIHMNGHGVNTETFTSDLWPQNNYVYVGTHQANKLLTFDVSDPANPILTDEQEFDARVVNDVKVSEDGQWLVATREGAADRRNGILVLSLDDPAKPRLVAEYTETLTAGVHNVFWVGTLVYAVNDGTGDLHIIDLADAANPREVGRWGLAVDGRSLHDIWVQDGVAYLSYLNDGLVIVDVGGAGHGGTPTEPVQVSRIFYPGGPTHTAMRYGDYVFVGDEDFSLQGTVPSAVGSDPRGPIHVIDVRDLANPQYAARYEVPEAGAHNIWIADGTLYIGYYQGGIRAVDISGELRGELYDQGREIAHFLPQAGPDEAMRAYSPNTWGVFPMFTNGWATDGDVLYATDYNSGLWTFTVEIPEDEIS